MRVNVSYASMPEGEGVRVNVSYARPGPIGGPPSHPFHVGHCSQRCNINNSFMRERARYGPRTGLPPTTRFTVGHVPYVPDSDILDDYETGMAHIQGVPRHAGYHPFHCWSMQVCKNDDHFLSRECQN